MFNSEDYNDNIGYCEYVWLKNIELGLELSTTTEIQYIANKYLDEVLARRGIDEEETYKNDKILLSVVEKHAKKLSKFRTLRSQNENNDLNPNTGQIYKEKLSEEEINEKLASEKELAKYGGYGYKESYDDQGLDEIVEEPLHR